MAGRVLLSDSDESTKAWVEFICYRLAVKINKENSITKKKEMFFCLPAELQKIVTKWGKINKLKKRVK